MVSTLTIHQTRPDHAGNYTCAPPHATSDTVRLYVAQGDQHGESLQRFVINIFRPESGAAAHRHPGADSLLHQRLEDVILLTLTFYIILYNQNAIPVSYIHGSHVLLILCRYNILLLILWRLNKGEVK